jgi:hypothetical protein
MVSLTKEWLAFDKLVPGKALTVAPSDYPEVLREHELHPEVLEPEGCLRYRRPHKLSESFFKFGHFRWL